MITASLAVAAPPQASAAANPASWEPWVIASADQFRLGAPPADDSVRTARELREIRQLQSELTAARERKIRFWNRGASTLRWTQVALDMIVKHRPGAFPTRSARLLTLLHVAMYDAMVAAYDSVKAYDRPRPWELDDRIEPLIRSGGSSYPDPRAAVAGGAERLLTYLFPDEDPSTFRSLANQAVRTRLWAGVNYGSDVERGRELGHDVATAVIAWGEADGHLLPWDFEDQRLCSTTDCAGADEAYWVPTPLIYQYPPTDPMASKWATWLLTTPWQYRPGPPPAYGSAEFMDQVRQVKEANDSSSPKDRELAFFWDDGPGTYSPAGHWNQIAMELARSRNLGFAQTARLFALMNVATWDAFAAAWDAKYTYWNVRPVTIIRERPTVLGVTNPYYDPGWLPNVVTPPFPSYISGHATESGAAARVLQYFFPDAGLDPATILDQPTALGSIDEIADEVARSRLIAGIHYPIDNEVGLTVGRQIAGLAITHAKADGAPYPG